METKSKFIHCKADRHNWPLHLEHFARICCTGLVRGEPVPKRSGNTKPRYLCHSGIHLWKDEERAIACCNTHVSVLTSRKDDLIFGPVPGFELKLIERDELMEMEEFPFVDSLHPKLKI